MEKIHDLVKLIKDTFKLDSSFEKFIPLTEKMTGYYIETRYPLGYETEFTKEEVENSMKETEKLINFIKEKFV